jgi:hypothetical protein
MDSNEPYEPYEPTPPPTPACLSCPICNEELPIMNYLTHLSERHPVTLGWMIGLSVQHETLQYPDDMDTPLGPALLLGMQTGAALGFWDLGYDGTLSGHLAQHYDSIYGIGLDTRESNDEIESLEYEALLNICETIGDHAVGVENIDEVAPLMDKNEYEGSCPICLELLADCDHARQIAHCKHIFCGTCLAQWLAVKKWCPLCKTEVCQMPSTSSSSSSLIFESASSGRPLDS